MAEIHENAPAKLSVLILRLCFWTAMGLLTVAFVVRVFDTWVQGAEEATRDYERWARWAIYAILFAPLARSATLAFAYVRLRKYGLALAAGLTVTFILLSVYMARP